MNITVTHTIDPKLMSLLETFVSSVGGQPAKEIVASTPAKTKSIRTTAPKELTEETASSASENGSAKKIEFTDIRQLYLQKKEAGKQELVKGILDEYGVEKLSAIKPEQFEEVYNKINAL
jgi:alpha-amylase/alpha-mannosidase (GH57 family)